MFSKRLESHEWSPLLFDLPDPPSRLYLVGKLPTNIGIAIVGTRRPTAEAVAFTEELVRALACAKPGEAKLSIWSGGAEGIDAAAHRSAMRAGIPTVVVAPAGWARPYPPEHAQLFQSVIAQGGAYLSLVEDHCVAKQHRFFARNAVLVALVQAVVVIQAGLRSGARNAAKFARQLGRPLYVVPSCPWTHQGLGCNVELELGARALGSASDLLLAAEAYSASISVTTRAGINPVRRAISTTPQLSPNAVQLAHVTDRLGGAAASLEVPKGDLGDALHAELNLLFEMIRAGAKDVDTLCIRTGLSASVVQSDLLRLTLLGLIRTDRTGAVTIVNS